MGEVTQRTEPNETFLKKKAFSDSLNVETKKDISPALSSLLDQTENHEDRVEILLLEILRALKPKT